MRSSPGSPGAPPANAVEELATLVAVLLRLRPDRAAFRAGEAHVLALSNPLARLAVGRALRATRASEATGEPEATLGPVDPAVLEAAVLELLHQARPQRRPGTPEGEGLGSPLRAARPPKTEGAGDGT